MCNDKISRQALLDEINEEIEYGEEHFRPENEQINKGLKIARKLVRALPAIEAEPDKGWVIDKLEDKLDQAYSDAVNDAQHYWNPRVAQDALQDAYSNVSCWIDEILDGGEEAQK